MGTENKSSTNSVVHRLVEEQYNRYPYPAAQENLDDFIRNRSYQAGCPSRFSHLYWPFRDKRTDLDILVAGCGTMQAPKFAVNLPGSRFVAIDICENSIEHTNRLLDLHDIRNVTTRKLAIEDVGDLGREFDLVVSTGVLHHLPDPVQGLDALRGVLRDDGSMYLMLYGKYGRDGVYVMQDLFRRAGLSAASATPEDLLAIRRTLEMLPAHHPVSAKKHYFNRFQVGDEELVDLFLHPQDRGYSLPDIYDYLDECGMKLQSMLFRAHYAPRCSHLAGLGLMDRISSLPDAEQLAIGELYRAAVHMHFFIACKQTRDSGDAIINLDAPDWKSLIPVSSPAIRQRKVGSGSATITEVSSPLHQFEDIRCTLTAGEAAFLGMSNGSMTIDAIQAATMTVFSELADDETLRDFNKKMLDYDLMTFRGDGHP